MKRKVKILHIQMSLKLHFSFRFSIKMKWLFFWMGMIEHMRKFDCCKNDVCTHGNALLVEFISRASMKFRIRVDKFRMRCHEFYVKSFHIEWMQSHANFVALAWENACMTENVIKIWLNNLIFIGDVSCAVKIQGLFCCWTDDDMKFKPNLCVDMSCDWINFFLLRL